jgi:hypothetical protein
MKISDPTREEMVTFCDGIAIDPTSDEFDYEEAIYWFANDYHGGQWSNLYSALSTSPFKPSPIASGVSSDGMAKWFYDELVRNYTSQP